MSPRSAASLLAHKADDLAFPALSPSQILLLVSPPTPKSTTLSSRRRIWPLSMRWISAQQVLARGTLSDMCSMHNYINADLLPGLEVPCQPRTVQWIERHHQSQRRATDGKRPIYACIRVQGTFFAELQSIANMASYLERPPRSCSPNSV